MVNSFIVNNLYINNYHKNKEVILFLGMDNK